MNDSPVYWFEGRLAASPGELIGVSVGTLLEHFCSIIGPRYQRLAPAARTTARHNWMAEKIVEIQRALLVAAADQGFDVTLLTEAEVAALLGDKRTVPQLLVWPHNAVPLLLMNSRGRNSTWKKPVGQTVLVVDIRTEASTLAGLIALGQLTGSGCLSSRSPVHDPRV